MGLLKKLGSFLGVFFLGGSICAASNSIVIRRVVPAAGASTFSIDISSNGTKSIVGAYTVIKCTGSTSLAVTGSGEVNIFIVGGAASGGWGFGGGGGAGGAQTSTPTLTDGTYQALIGAGAPDVPNAHGTNGSDTSLVGVITSTGGGYGESGNQDGAGNGGSGGGRSNAGSVAATGIAGQGNNGGTTTHEPGAGGGGATGVGSSPVEDTDQAAGGTGVQNDFATGSLQTYATGGKGGYYSPATPVNGGDGAPNTGNGGDGGNYTGNGGHGGSGILIVRYLTP